MGKESALGRDQARDYAYHQFICAGGRGGAGSLDRPEIKISERNDSTVFHGKIHIRESPRLLGRGPIVIKGLTVPDGQLRKYRRRCPG